MRSINIANSNKRDAEVGLEAVSAKSGIKYILPDGNDRKITKVLKSTMSLADEELVKQFDNDYVALGNAIIDGDPEIDTEKLGKIINRTRKLYLDQNNKVVYHVNLYQVRKAPDGTEKDRKDLVKAESNVSLEDIPVQWTGKKMPKKEAIKRFVFSRKYQIKHISGLTYDFLYNMAKELQDAESLMLIGGGKKGNEPLILTTGGEPYRGFLEGRVEGDKYCLILHLTNMELKGVEVEVI